MLCCTSSRTKPISSLTIRFSACLRLPGHSFGIIREATLRHLDLKRSPRQNRLPKDRTWGKCRPAPRPRSSPQGSSAARGMASGNPMGPSLLTERSSAITDVGAFISQSTRVRAGRSPNAFPLCQAMWPLPRRKRRTRGDQQVHAPPQCRNSLGVPLRRQGNHSRGSQAGLKTAQKVKHLLDVFFAHGGALTI